MKKGTRNNDFDQTLLQRWFMDNYECWNCGQNHWNCFHHILGRGGGVEDVESSILNAAPLNNHQCHLPIHGELRRVDNVVRLLHKTMRYLLAQGYEFSEKDERFIIKYQKHYDIDVDKDVV